MPLDLLAVGLTQDEEIDAKVAELNAYLHEYEGCHSFHNFHRLRSSEVTAAKHRKRSRYEQDNTKAMGTGSGTEAAHIVVPVVPDVLPWQEAAQTVVDEPDQEHGDEDDDEDEEEDEEEEDEPAVYNAQAINQDWSEVPRPSAPRTTCLIYTCRASWYRSNEGRVMVKVRLTGQSFLLHMIRLMMSAAFMTMRGILPKDFIKVRIDDPVFPAISALFCVCRVLCAASVLD